MHPVQLAPDQHRVPHLPHRPGGGLLLGEPPLAQREAPRGGEGLMRRALTVAAAAVATVLVVVSLLGRAELTGLSESCLEIEEYIAELEEENARLLIEHETAYSAARIEEYAREVLGMQSPASGQIIYIESGDADWAEIPASEP